MRSVLNYVVLCRGVFFFQVHTLREQLENVGAEWFYYIQSELYQMKRDKDKIVNMHCNHIIIIYKSKLQNVCLLKNYISKI